MSIIEENTVKVTSSLSPLRMSSNCIGSSWESYDIGNGMAVSFPSESKPSISWKHVDGPMLICRDGTIHWLTIWERLQFRLGFIDIDYLDKKHGDYTKQRRIS